MSQALSSFRAAVLDIVYPRTCVGCGAAADRGGGHLCWDCLAAIDVVVAPFCRVCGDPAEGLLEQDYACSWCRRDPPAFETARSAARYRGPLCAAVQALKYDRATHLSVDLAALLAACVRTHYAHITFDGVACVPLHPRRERERTYNQAHLLAARLAHELGRPLLGRALRRTRDTRTQTDLNAAARRANVAGAFQASDDGWIAGRTLLLVDDVMTTGATLRECAAALKRAGAAAVHVATVGRG